MLIGKQIGLNEHVVPVKFFGSLSRPRERPSIQNLLQDNKKNSSVNLSGRNEKHAILINEMKTLD